jgi:hypothetical protein
MMFKRKKRRPGETGQAAVEFALAFIVFIPILFGIIDLGWITFQKTAFEYGYMHSSREVKAKDIGDNGSLETESRVKITGEAVRAPLRTLIEQYSSMIIADNLYIGDATAEFYTVIDKEKYTVPSIDGGVEAGISGTRYMELDVLVTYRIYPLTPIGKAIFGPRWEVEKKLDCTRIVRTQHRYEYR